LFKNVSTYRERERDKERESDKERERERQRDKETTRQREGDVEQTNKKSGEQRTREIPKTQKKNLKVTQEDKEDQAHEVGAVVVGVELEQPLAQVDARGQRLVAKSHQVARACQTEKNKRLGTHVFDLMCDHS